MWRNLHAVAPASRRLSRDRQFSVILRRVLAPKDLCNWAPAMAHQGILTMLPIFSPRADLYAHCSRNLTSPLKNNCKSSTPYFNKAIRSAPMPKANPETFLGSYPLSLTNSNTLGSTMPHPRISIHPVCLQGRQGSAPRFPLPPQIKQETNISALGSVNGKNDGRKLVFTLEPKNSFMA